MEKVKLPEEFRSAIKACGTLAYIWNDEEAMPYTLKKSVSSTTHGSVSRKGTFLSCLVGSVELPAGTEGFLFVRDKIHYSSYVWVGDQQYPSKGSDVIKTGSYYTFVTFVNIDGFRILADHFCETTHDAKAIGKL